MTSGKGFKVEESGTLRILYFGRVRDVMGLEFEDVEVERDISSLAILLAWIGDKHPALGQMIISNGLKVAVDGRVVGEEDSFSRPRTIVLFPPLSGG